MYSDEEETPLPSENLLFSLSHYFDYSGLNNPYNRIYITANSSEDFAVILFVFIIAHLQRLYLPKGSGGTRKLQEPLDGFAFTIAVHTILKQFHESLNGLFIKYLVDYCCNLTKHSIRYVCDITKNILISLYFVLARKIWNCL